MTNEITIDLRKFLNAEDNSIKDYETIRQIGLLSCYVNDYTEEEKKVLYKKVYRPYSFVGLYPDVMKSFDIIPDALD